MKNLKFTLLFVFLFCFSKINSQNNWTRIEPSSISKNKNTERLSFPKDFGVYQTSFTAIKSKLQNAPSVLKTKNSQNIITIPNSKGVEERFEIFEFSNFDSELQQQFPEIRSYTGKGIDDKNATIRLSIDPRGMQAMVFRTDKKNEFIEPYSDNPNVYVVYESQRAKGQLPFTCSTDDVNLTTEISNRTNSLARSSSGELLIFRLALSSTSEYAAYFGATSASQWNLVLAAYNATMTRVNGVFEKDFAIHMNIISQSQNVAYYNAATDPYSAAATGSGGAWNTELQNTLTSVIGNANYDVGHLFGASGGGGNAGCIGCVCVDDTSSLTDKNKGSGYTSPADGIPMGDNFDIDYVAHEMGHQFGGNHTFSHTTEGTGVNVEPGSGSTIMGYAGITTRDVQPHSDDYFVYASIKQVQDNMVTKTCPTRVTLSNNEPIVNAGLDYTIPKSTPFILTGTATDPDGDVLTYCWEENDSATTQTGANSAAIITKTGGPNWRSYSPVSVPYRYFPRIQSVIANSATTAGSEINVEALSSVARTLNFVLTARDNVAGAGQTNSDAMVVTVNATAGPFAVTAPNTAVSWTVGTNQTVTWSVAGTTANGVNCNYVDIYLSTDGGFTYPILLASNVPNDGSETVTVPNAIGTTNRVMVKGNKHIFFDISNANFSIVAPTSSFAVDFGSVAGEQNKSICNGDNANYTLNYTALSGFTGTTTFTASGQPSGSTVTFTPSSINVSGSVAVSVTNTTTATPGFYTIVVTATSGATSRTVNYYLTVNNSNFSTLSLTSPANQAEGQLTNLTLNWSADAAATFYNLQVATDEDFTNIIVNTNPTTNSYALTALSELTNYFWRVIPKNAGCQGNFSATSRFTTGQQVCNNFSSTNVPLAIATTANYTINSTLNIPVASNQVISDINVTVNITHTWVADLVVTLISPAGTQVQLVSGQCTSNDDINATFDNSGNALVCGATPTISGFVIPAQSLATLNGENSQGTWTLRVLDTANGDGGSLNSWSLNICSTPNVPVTCGQITTTWNGTSWSNGKPQNNVAATINGNYNSTGDLTACSLNIIGTSQVIFTSGTNTTVTDVINVASTASLTVENNANIIQINNVTNTAEAIVNRNSNPLMRLDYTIWSSPVIGTQTLKQFSPNTLNNRFYNYNTTTNLYNAVANPVTQTFGLGNGYLIRTPNDHPTTPTIWSGQFNGNLNNGNVDVNLTYIASGQSFNMIGNPYPSTIDADTFITDNLSDITGTLYFWRKTNNAAGTAYATYTLGGATTTSPTSPTPNGIIQTGQGFIVEANNVSTPTVSFLNSQRVGNNQNQFFRSTITAEKHRIWLNLTDANGLFSQSLIGYMTNATEAFDNGIDGKYLNDSPVCFNSLLNDGEYSVQFRGLTFATTDVFPMLFKTDIAGDFTIGLDHADGLFTSGQNVYLRDNVLQTVHNLSEGSYDFASEVGIFNNRFDVIFEPTALGNNEFNPNSVVVYTNNNQIHLNSGNAMMNTVIVHDTLGRLLYSNEVIQNNQLSISNLNAKNQALFITIVLENGNKVVKKIAY